ncbi:MAG: hypothetical protein D6717_07630 [Gammaproteobacteria bacterium]|nr:MAG: hypothetical protein D6717_07630 [Gammaproteobacteria bacterium]
MKSINTLARALKSTATLIDLVDTGNNPTAVIADLRERLQSLKEQLLDVREEMAALREEKLQLAERLAQATGKKLDPDRYRRVTLETGSVVYEEPGTNNQPNQKPVYFCARCFREGIESILQIHKEEFHRDIYQCDTCGSKALVPNDREMTVSTIPGRDSLDEF